MSAITDAIERRTVDFVERGDKDITIVFLDGFQATLGVDENSEIQLIGTGIRLSLSGLSIIEPPQGSEII